MTSNVAIDCYDDNYWAYTLIFVLPSVFFFVGFVNNTFRNNLFYFFKQLFLKKSVFIQVLFFKIIYIS